jgi:hypothetical protein
MDGLSFCRAPDEKATRANGSPGRSQIHHNANLFSLSSFTSRPPAFLPRGRGIGGYSAFSRTFRDRVKGQSTQRRWLLPFTLGGGATVEKESSTAAYNLISPHTHFSPFASTFRSGLFSVRDSRLPRQPRLRDAESTEHPRSAARPHASAETAPRRRAPRTGGGPRRRSYAVHRSGERGA